MVKNASSVTVTQNIEDTQFINEKLIFLTIDYSSLAKLHACNIVVLFKLLLNFAVEILFVIQSRKFTNEMWFKTYTAITLILISAMFTIHYNKSLELVTEHL